MSISCAAPPCPTFPLNHLFVEKLKNATLVDKAQVGKVELLLKTPQDRKFFPPESKMGMLDEMTNNQRMIDKIVKIESRNVNIECFIIMIKTVKIKKLKESSLVYDCMFDIERNLAINPGIRVSR